MADDRNILRKSSERIIGSDPDLAKKLDRLRALAGHRTMVEKVAEVQEKLGGTEAVGGGDMALETIVNRVGRPVLEIAANDFIVAGAEAEIWADRIDKAAFHTTMKRVIPAVGRIEVQHHPDNPLYLGTGWLIREDILVTNRHVADEFATLSITANGTRSFKFRRGFPGPNMLMSASVDFRREMRNSDPLSFDIQDVLHIEDDDGPDFALLKVKRGTGTLAAKIEAFSGDSSAVQFIATIGYPASDSRIPDHQLMQTLFGDKYNVKRLSPGFLKNVSRDLLLHDCTTLGGNSGSPVIDLGSGTVMALHFSGVFERENRAVPIGHVTSRLDKLLGPVTPNEKPKGTAVPPVSPPPLSVVPAPQGPVTFTVPLNITISLGGGATAVAVANTAAPAKPGSVPEAVAAVRERVGGRSDILMVRDGYLFHDGWITPDPAVVVVLKNRGGTVPAALGLPGEIGGIPIEVRAASPWDIAAAEGKLAALEGVPRTSYKPPTGFQLEAVNEKMSVTCHVSPDAGWPTLREFLQPTSKTLTIGMYDFTAPHITDAVLAAVEDSPKKLALVLQTGEALGGKPDDIPEETTLERYRGALGARFNHAPASIGKDHQFASAYHIKVAVRDSKAFWISSGNMQSSNQPNREFDENETSWAPLLDNNREWHSVVENPNLAKQFEKFIEYDLANAKADAETEAAPTAEAFFLVDEAVEERVPTGTPTYFAPLKINRKVKVQPVLTPDNYGEHVLKLIESAETEILFQNQSLSLLGLDNQGNDKNDDRFLALVDALLAKQKAGVKVFIIIRGEFAPVGPLEQLQKRGCDMDKVRLQNRCHNKGIVVDRERVLVSSQNWTNQGTTVNRDAGLIFDDAEIAEYYAQIFWFDWKNLARASVGGSRRIRPAPADGGNEEGTTGAVRMSWREIVEGG